MDQGWPTVPLQLANKALTLSQYILNACLSVGGICLNLSRIIASRVTSIFGEAVSCD